METTNHIPRILVIGSEPTFLDMTKKGLGPSFEVTFVSNDNEALKQARRERPDAILLGHLEPRDAATELHRKLQGGWITRNIPILTIDDGLSATSRQDSTSIAQLPEPADLREKLTAILKEKQNTLKAAILDPDTFCITWEQIAGRGAFEMQQEEIIDNARKASQDRMIHGLSLTDNPSGNPAISTETLCVEIKKIGIEPLVHVACRDRNRNEIEGILYSLAASGITNLLILTGDYTSDTGFSGVSKPVFDLDPIHVLQLVATMNRGLEHEVMRKKQILAPTDFFAGVVVSPFKQQEAELMGQYYKLGKKIQAGAKFVITQVGYDVRKLHEVLQWLKANGYNIPVIANIYVLPYGAAKTMNANQIPGCLVTDKLVAELAEEAKAEDKGKSARLLRAAKMYAIAKGMGCAGAHIGGHRITHEMVDYIIEKGKELSPNWQEFVAEFDYPQPNGFYFFEKDSETGLNRDKPAVRTQKPSAPPIYGLARMAHALLFNPDSLLFKMLRPIARSIDSSRLLAKAFGNFEHQAKVALFGCMNCGDCALFDVAYQCPMSQCPKNQRNGPCGGSYEGWCEVYPNEKKCIWVKAYERLKASKKEDEMGAYVAPPCNWELWQTSSWLNFYMGRDHSAKRLGIKPPPTQL